MRLNLAKTLTFSAESISFDIFRERSISVFAGREKGETKPESVGNFHVDVGSDGSLRCVVFPAQSSSLAS